MPAQTNYVETIQPTIFFTCLCLTCKIKHEMSGTPLTWLQRLDEWQQKHPQPHHDTEFRSRNRRVPAGIEDTAFVDANAAPWWLEFRENTDIKVAYASSAAYTCTLESLASSSTLVVGRETTAVSNTTNLYLGYLVGGHVTVHQSTAVTAATRIEVYAYGAYNDTPTYPSPITGSDAGVTFADISTRDAKVTFFADMPVPVTTANITYRFSARNLAPSFRGLIPKNHGFFVTHNTGQALHNSAAGAIYQTGAYVVAA